MRTKELKRYVKYYNEMEETRKKLMELEEKFYDLNNKLLERIYKEHSTYKWEKYEPYYCVGCNICHSHAVETALNVIREREK